MKTLPLIALIAALGAFLFSPVSFELSISLILTLGVASILVSDYRSRRRLVAHARTGAGRKKAPLPLAV